MGRHSRKLTAVEVGRLNSPGKFPVGEGLYLQVSKTNTRSWLFRYRISEKTTWMGLGSVRFVTLSEARSKASSFQRDLADGLNPLGARIEAERSQAAKELTRISFKECATKYIEAHAPSWKNKKHIFQWSSTLETYAFPLVGALPVGEVDTTLVLKILEPIWYSKSETASRLRGRIERILSWAAVRGFRGIENPARWRGHLDQLLPKRSAIQKVQHFKALPFSDVGSFIGKLHAQQTVGTLALEFTILTATRTNETLGAKWTEINITERYWLIPAERMKSKREHKIPLTTRMIEILNEVQRISRCDFIFPGTKRKSPLSDMALLMIIRRMGLRVTTHGFRSSFSDWAAERTNFPREVVEMALAHAVKNKVEAAYRRGDLFDKRRDLMEAWSLFLDANKIENNSRDVFSGIRKETA